MRAWLILALAIAASACSTSSARTHGGGQIGGVPTPTPRVAVSSEEPVRTGAAWVSDVGRLCAEGAARYPSLALGTAANVDTISFGVNELGQGLKAIAPPDEPRAARRAADVVADADALSAAWTAMATAPTARSSARRAGVRDLRDLLASLVASGARQCAALVPAS